MDPNLLAAAGVASEVPGVTFPGSGGPGEGESCSAPGKVVSAGVAGGVLAVLAVLLIASAAFLVVLWRRALKRRQRPSLPAAAAPPPQVQGKVS